MYNSAIIKLKPRRVMLFIYLIKPNICDKYLILFILQCHNTVII